MARGWRALAVAGALFLPAWAQAEGAARPAAAAPTWADGLAETLNHPVCTVLLLAIGLLCLYAEVALAGMGMMWIPATLCFALFFWSKILGGTVGWLALALFAVGIACLAAELFVIPGFGVAGVSGIVLTLLGLAVAVQGFVAPATPADWAQAGYGLAQLGSAVVLATAAAGFASRHLERLPMFRQLILAPTPGDEPMFAEMAGRTGIAATALRPAGKARFGSRVLDVVTDGFYVPADAPVEVVATAGNRVVVRKV